MPYIDIVNNLSQKNRFEYNHKAIYKQVRKAMKSANSKRDLKKVLVSAFRTESARYESMRQQLGADLHTMDPNTAYEMNMALRRMATPAQFLEEFTQIIGAMAKDVAPSYNLDHMLGLSSRQSKNLVRHQLNSYTRLDETMYTLKRDGWEEALRTVENIRRDVMTDEIRDLATTDEEHKAGMYDTYMRKEAVKQELKNNGFWWRLINRSEANQMRAYIAAAESALRDVHFTDAAANEAVEEFSKPAALETDYQLSYESIDKNYKDNTKILNKENDISAHNYNLIPYSHQELEPMMFFDPNYIPNIYHIEDEKEFAEKWRAKMNEVQEFEKKGFFAKFASRNTPIAKFSKLLNKSPNAKTIFEQNYNRLNSVLAKSEKERGDYVLSQCSDYNGEAQDFWDDNPDYKIPNAVEGLISTEVVNISINEKSVPNPVNEKIAEPMDLSSEFAKDTNVQKAEKIPENPNVKKDLQV